MYKLLFLLVIFPSLALAAGPQGNPQIYHLNSEHQNHVVMLTDRFDSKGTEFATFEDYNKITQTYFREGQAVSAWCANKIHTNKVDRIDAMPDQGASAMQLTTIHLEKPLSCKGVNLISNYPLPEQHWTTNKLTKDEMEIIQKKFGLEGIPKITVINSQKHGKFFLVYDAKIKAIYDAGGYRLLDKNYSEVSVLNWGANVSPIIDLDNDGMPEFFVRSTDGVDAWIVTMFPKYVESNEIGKLQ